MSPSPRRIALKVDCDTFEGSQKGLPNLIRLFADHRIQASFFFTLGPDTSGRAIFRVFTQKGFLKKMLRSNAAALYGPRTMMYGTLLPSPLIWKKLSSEIRAVGDAGHDIGVHGWDHIRWHDKVGRMSESAIEHDYRRAHDAFASIFGKPARSSAAPGWHITPTALNVHEKFNLTHTSNTRGGAPFFPKDGNHVFNILEIPSTLPTWDEALADPVIKSKEDLLSHFRSLIKGTEVHSIHTEVEATAHFDLFKKQIEMWKADGVQFVTLDQIAKETLQNRSAVPSCELRRIEIPNRGGLVSSGHPEIYS